MSDREARAARRNLLREVAVLVTEGVVTMQRALGPVDVVFGQLFQANPISKNLEEKSPKL